MTIAPIGWQPGHRIALLVPGLGGSHKTPYLVRSAAKLNRRGTHTFRIDQQGFGSAAKLARLPYHAGRSEDVAAALRVIDQLTGGSSTSLVGSANQGFFWWEIDITYYLIKLLERVGQVWDVRNPPPAKFLGRSGRDRWLLNGPVS